MKVTRTIEVEVCERCGSDEKVGWRLFRCQSCLREVCRGCHSYYNVDVSFSEPQQRTKEVPHRSTLVSQPQEFEFRGSFCGDCGDRINAVLTAAGLTKRPAEPREAALLDRATIPV